MASSPAASIENQIDSFLEQFKRSATRAMEDRSVRSNNNASSITRSRSENLDLEILEAGKKFNPASSAIMLEIYLTRFSDNAR